MLLKVLHKKYLKQQKHSELNFEPTRVEHVKSSWKHILAPNIGLKAEIAGSNKCINLHFNSIN
jgi:hypothetical protein